MFSSGLAARTNNGSPVYELCAWIIVIALLYFLFKLVGLLLAH